jgi:hypothetical protein
VAHAASHVISHRGVRMPPAGGFAIAAAGILLLAGVDSHGSCAADVLPGTLIAGLGLGIVLVCVSVAVLTGASDDEAGMLPTRRPDGPMRCSIGAKLTPVPQATSSTLASGRRSRSAIVHALAREYKSRSRLAQS